MIEMPDMLPSVIRIFVNAGITENPCPRSLEKKYFILLKVLNSRFLESSILFSAELRKYYYPLSPPPICRHLLFQFGIVLLLNVCCSF